jgi:hypothetical protein
VIASAISAATAARTEAFKDEAYTRMVEDWKVCLARHLASEAF